MELKIKILLSICLVLMFLVVGCVNFRSDDKPAKLRMTFLVKDRIDRDRLGVACMGLCTVLTQSGDTFESFDPGVCISMQKGETVTADFQDMGDKINGFCSGKLYISKVIKKCSDGNIEC
jgi:hypothetical protein